MLRWPLQAIDFEASSLDGGYPIEVGIAIWPKRDRAIYSWSALIRPTWRWIDSGRWDRKAERVHGISREELLRALEASTVVMRLNSLLGSGSAAWCDGGDFDAHWMQQLFDAAGQGRRSRWANGKRWPLPSTLVPVRKRSIGASEKWPGIAHVRTRKHCFVRSLPPSTALLIVAFSMMATRSLTATSRVGRLLNGLLAWIGARACTA